MYFTIEILCLFSLMHDPWMPSLEHTTALCMDCCNAVSHLFRTMHVNVLLQNSETYMAFDADDYPCWNMVSKHKHLIPVLDNFEMVVTAVRKLCCVYLIFDDDLAGR